MSRRGASRSISKELSQGEVQHVVVHVVSNLAVATILTQPNPLHNARAGPFVRAREPLSLQQVQHGDVEHREADSCERQPFQADHQRHKPPKHRCRRENLFESWALHTARVYSTGVLVSLMIVRTLPALCWSVQSRSRCSPSGQTFSVETSWLKGTHYTGAMVGIPHPNVVYLSVCRPCIK